MEFIDIIITRTTFSYNFAENIRVAVRDRAVDLQTTPTLYCYNFQRLMLFTLFFLG